MKILLMSPTFCKQQSEQTFIESLTKIHAYKDIKAMGSHYLLELSNTFNRQTVDQLNKLFDHWGIDPSPLVTLAELAEADTQ